MLLVEGLKHADRHRFDYRYGYFLPSKDAMVPALEAQGVEVRCFRARGTLSLLLAARRVAEDLRHHKVDLLHCHLPVSGAVGRVAGRLAGVPVLYTEHNKQERYHPATRLLNRATWRWQTRVVAVSADVRTSIEAHLGRRVPVQVVVNGVDVSRFSRDPRAGGEVRRRLGIPSHARVVGSVAVFRRQKRLDHWLRAAQQVSARNPGTRFILVGAGPLMDEVHALRARLGLEAVLHLPGLQEDVTPWLSAMDIYLMSSEFEGLPVALLEAMAAECVPVCTAVGGIPEVVQDGETGRLVQAGDPGRLAEAVAGLLDDPATLECLSRCARRSVSERFSMERMTRELEAIYDRILAARHA